MSDEEHSPPPLLDSVNLEIYQGAQAIGQRLRQAKRPDLVNAVEVPPEMILDEGQQASDASEVLIQVPPDQVVVDVPPELVEMIGPSDPTPPAPHPLPMPGQALDEPPVIEAEIISVEPLVLPMDQVEPE